MTLGLLPGNGGTQRLPRIIAPGPALELLLTGRRSAPTRRCASASSSGVFADRGGVRRAQSPSRSPRARRWRSPTIKRAVHEGMRAPTRRRAGLERELIEDLFRSKDATEGLAAFSEKRAPEFVGA